MTDTEAERTADEVRCTLCNAPAERRNSEWGYFYICIHCDAKVGCHKGTSKPLGTFATKPMRDARMRAHAAFDPLWEKHFDSRLPKGQPQRYVRYMKRTDAYHWLKVKMGLTVEPHIGEFNEAQCEQVVQLCKAFFAKHRERKPVGKPRTPFINHSQKKS